MKKLILFSIISLFLTVAFSQEEQQSLKFGARLGYQMQSVSEDDVDMGFLGFSGGIKTIVPITENLSFAPELSFLFRQLYTVEETLGTTKVEGDVIELAISVPLLLQLKATDAFYLATGLQLDIPLSTGANEKITLNGESSSRYYDIKGRASVDLGIPLGVGLYITESIALDLRAVIGLTDMGESGGVPFNQYGLGIAYFF